MNFDVEGIISFLQVEGIDWGINVLGAVAIFIIGKKVVKILTKLVRKMMGRAKMDATLISFLGNIIYGIGLAFVVIASLSNLGVETTSLAAVIAAAGLAVGLALQGSLSNLAAGVMIIGFRPFVKGDFVDAGGVAGTIDEVSIFNTKMKTPDNKLIIVPNGNITSATITNFSAMDTRRVDLTFGIGYGDDLKQAKDILSELCSNDERILKDPATTIAIGSLGDSSVNILCRPWVKSEDYWAVHWELTEAVKLRFDAEGISIPFPQQDVHMHQVDIKPAKKAA